jgi:flagellar hook-basal body complex protein FliE
MRIGSLPGISPSEMNPLQKLDEMSGSLMPGMAAGIKGPGLGVASPSMGVGGAMRAEFSSFLNKAVTEVEGKMRAAEVEKQKVLTGETNNLHQATIAASEAGLAFSLMVEVRNKLVESYQEMIRMQV